MKLNNNSVRDLCLYIVIGIVYLCLIYFDVRGVLHYKSSDEQYFLHISRFLKSGYQNYLRYIVWGLYVETLSRIYYHLPQIINIFLSISLMYILVRRYEINAFLGIFFLLLLPSVTFYTISFCRDIILLFSSSTLLLLIKQRRASEYILAVGVALLAILLRTPLMLVFILALFIMNFKRTGLLLFCIIMLGVAVLPLFSDSFYQFYTFKLSVLDEGTFRMGTLGFTESNFPPSAASITILFNWLGFWFTYHPSHIDNFKKIILLIDTFLIFAMFIIAIKRFTFKKLNDSFIYRFSLFIILTSFLFAIFETGYETILRHKLFFLPYLFLLAFHNDSLFCRNESK